MKPSAQSDRRPLNLLQLLHWSGFHKCNLSSLRFNTLPHTNLIASPSSPESSLDTCVPIAKKFLFRHLLIRHLRIYRVTCAFPSSDACHRTTAFNSPCPPIPIKPPTVPSKPLFLSVTSKLTSSDLLHHHNEAIEPCLHSLCTNSSKSGRRG
ncbi:hypothetical protein BLNAU_5470 [Blattamonas nauphoetae]|uniref:Uncharacterized protein n=1 Tax=Blattamonas nauphoetae TaxID=2049346 RepID=A0ABQ9Y7M2_9EUKA|nr:hypothetical protein BLNAU_5470 [Blattamonas nauphoetae]